MELYIVNRIKNDASPSIFGWTNSLSLIRLFLQQRSNKKYKIQTVETDEVEPEVLYDYLNESNELDFLELQAQSGDVISFITTQSEVREVKYKIFDLFRSLADLVKYDNGNNTLYTLYLNLNDYYKSALDYIEFYPPGLFCEDEYKYNLQFATSGAINEHPSDEDECLSDVYYSLESYTKVLLEDL